MDAEEREQILQTLKAIMERRAEERQILDSALQEFSTRLFAALEHVLDEMKAENVPGLGKYRRLAHPHAKGREAFQMFVEDWSIIFVPLSGIARPNADDEALVAQVFFKQPSARIAVFLSDDPQGEAFYDFLIFTDRSWFAWGYGWPRQQSDIENTDFDELALGLVHSFSKDIFTTWHTRATTILAEALDVKKRCYTFGLPGEEQRGG